MKRIFYTVLFFTFSFISILGLAGVGRGSQLVGASVVASVGLSGAAVLTLLLRRQKMKELRKQDMAKSSPSPIDAATNVKPNRRLR